jgi:hypothetical protein
VRARSRRLAQKLAIAKADPSAWPSFVASPKATFAHWEHGTTYRLREQTLRELGILHADAPPGEVSAALVAAREERDSEELEPSDEPDD